MQIKNRQVFRGGALAVFIGTVLMGMLSMPGASSAEDWEALDKDRFAAIRALYGEGLSITVTGNNISIDWGELTEKQWQKYAEKYYLPALENFSSELTVASLARFRGGKGRQKEVSSDILIEPIEKRALCVKLAEGLSKSARARHYCLGQAIKHAEHAIVAFRGSPVTYENVGTELAYPLGVKFEQDLFAGKKGQRNVLITVIGPVRDHGYRALAVVDAVLGEIRYATEELPDTLRQLGTDADARNRREQKAAKAKIAKRDKPFRKRRGSIVLGSNYIEGWDPIKLLKKNSKSTCLDSYAHVYGPKQRGDWELVVRANGIKCAEVMNRQGFVTHLSIFGTCRKYIQTGKNKIELTVAKNINKVAGRRWDKRKLKRVTYYSNKPGKVAAKVKMTCIHQPQK